MSLFSWAHEVAFLCPDYDLTLRSGQTCSSHATLGAEVFNGVKQQLQNVIGVVNVSGRFFLYEHKVEGCFEHAWSEGVVLIREDSLALVDLTIRIAINKGVGVIVEVEAKANTNNCLRILV